MQLKCLILHKQDSLQVLKGVKAMLRILLNRLNKVILLWVKKKMVKMLILKCTCFTILMAWLCIMKITLKIILWQKKFNLNFKIAI